MRMTSGAIIMIAGALFYFAGISTDTSLAWNYGIILHGIGVSVFIWGLLRGTKSKHYRHEKNRNGE